MKNTLTIRRAVIEDVDAILNIHAAAIQQLCAADYTPEQIAAWGYRRQAKDYIPRIQRDPTFVAILEKRIVGFVRFYVPTSELASIFIDPDFARQGIGTTLMQHAIAQAKQLGLTSFWLTSSLTAVPFYQSLGFIIEKEVQHQMPTTTLEAIQMHLQFS